MKSIPSFAIAGDPNAGKSTLVATLAEDDAVKISRRAGTTKRATPYRAIVGNTPVIEFIDLPGFENSAYLREWFERHRDEPGDLTSRFVNEHADEEDFIPECEILRSLRERAVLFVVDATRPVENRDRDQAEILRLSTDKRLAILNIRSEESAADPGILDEWRRLLGRSFTYEEFDPLNADFAARIQLLRKIAEVIPGWRDRVIEAIRLFESDWQDKRLPDTTDAVLQLISDVLSIEETATIDTGKGSDNSRKTTSEKCRKNVEDGVRKREMRFRGEIRQLYRHRLADWQLEEYVALDEDLFSERVWTLFGLKKLQLILTSAVIGLVIGAGIDIGVGGSSFFLGAAIGAATGAVTGWLAADKAVDVTFPSPLRFLKVPFPGKLRIRAEDKIVARVEPKSNLVWILIDRALLFIRASSNWSHGHREPPRNIEAGGKAGIATKWEKEERDILSQWIGGLRSDKISRKALEIHEMRAREFLLREIRKLVDRR